jgi:hypothetical protein
MEQGENKLAGLFEGYLKKHKTLAGLTLFNEYTKRYFILHLERFEMAYYKNRKKKGKPSIVPIRELLLIEKIDPEGAEGNKNSGKEWGYEFKV